MLGGARSQSAIAEWVATHGAAWRQRLGFTHARGPSQATVHRVFARLDVAALEQALSAWAQAVVAALPPAPSSPPDAIAVDGKTLRASAQAGAVDAHLLSALHQRLGIVLAQVGVADKTNEIRACEALFATLVLDGLVVTTDALLTQQHLAHAILAAGGDYLMEVKDNQPTLAADLTILFADADAPVVEATSVDLHGGRIEQRRLRASTELVGYSAWPGLAQALCLERQVVDKRTGIMTQETRYGVTSLVPERVTAQQLLVLWRQHWHTENKLHYVRDVTFGEDAQRVRCGHAPQVMAAVRNAVIGLLRVTGSRNIAAACRAYAAQPAAALAAVGAYRQ